MSKCEVPANLYPYQRELYEKAVNEDAIIFLPTGAGKTVLAASVMSSKLEHYPDKKVVFVVSRVPLVMQQAKTLQRAMGFGRAVATVCGAKRSLTTWSAFMESSCVGLVIIDSIFYRWMQEFPSAIKNNISLIVIDEVHNALGGYCKMIVEYIHTNAPRDRQKEAREYPDTPPTLPFILGLTASPVQSFTNQESLFELLSITRCRIFNVVANKENLHEVVPVPMTICLEYHLPPHETAFQQFMRSAIDILHNDENIGKNKLLKAIKNTIPAQAAYVNKCEQIQIAAVQGKHGDYDLFAKNMAFVLSSFSRAVMTLDCRSLWDALKVVMDKSVFAALQSSREVAALVLPIMQGMLELMKAVLDNDGAIRSDQNMVQPIIRQPRLTVCSRMLFLGQVLSWIAKSAKEGEADVCGIILCDTRTSVYYICDQIKKVPLLMEVFRPQLVIGKGKVCVDGVTVHMTDAQQRAILDDFKAGATKLLVATSLLEEGLDVGRCNFVIRYDSCLTLRSFIQSRGRARKRNAVYIVCESAQRSIKTSQVALKALKLQEDLVNRARATVEYKLTKGYVWKDNPLLWLGRIEKAYGVKIAQEETYGDTDTVGAWTCKLSVALPVAGKGEGSTNRGRKGDERRAFVGNQQVFVGVGRGSAKAARRAAAEQLCRELEDADYFQGLPDEHFSEPRKPFMFLSNGLCICDTNTADLEMHRRLYGPEVKIVKHYDKSRWLPTSPTRVLQLHLRRRKLPQLRVDVDNAKKPPVLTLTIQNRETDGKLTDVSWSGSGDDALQEGAFSLLTKLGVVCLENVPISDVDTDGIQIIEDAVGEELFEYL
ncbi:Type III restriction enzyme res subunit DEAD DEAH box helicase Helicase conserved C terminal domain [Trypanosoma vivax]|uniref:Putative ATP-dependent DEAD/H RNA helicase n=1 Tax=Trypanosoma vivax (strain Y486) TaxID=1055687 RepID=G0TYA4_TRYVY|nr:putative ATP-dependent DEAD/H RNA helicase [Trypanosoma vivax]KAH8619745.1 Type III restriction enzyme res subunit DEAD DEAH box helicase Helicase conserved C terminal domain [Trypanosoma vivax]CCC48949.1 putative ATP-dependent DEAD/H RNA helicase [Trypanosoma vivax Y486]